MPAFFHKLNMADKIHFYSFPLIFLKIVKNDLASVYSTAASFKQKTLCKINLHVPLQVICFQRQRHRNGKSL